MLPNSLFWKRLFDLFFSFLILILTVPLWPFIGLLIKLDSRGPILFQQNRVGMNQKIFTMYKFRTMIFQPIEKSMNLTSYKDDPRVTRVGRFLRVSSLDELPQILNVIKGEMSLVGPRPPVVGELDHLTNISEQLKARYKVRPGITGLAQISGRNSLSTQQRIRLDLEYVQMQSRSWFPLDLRILASTLLVVIRRTNVYERRMID